jgi:hypothetical protein
MAVASWRPRSRNGDEFDRSLLRTSDGALDGLGERVSALLDDVKTAPVQR